jgi:hypothetical protein
MAIGLGARVFTRVAGAGKPAWTRGSGKTLTLDRPLTRTDVSVAADRQAGGERGAVVAG